MDFRKLLQEDNRSMTNVSRPGTGSPSAYEGVEFGVAIFMLMALGSCCLVTCCNCIRIGLAVFINYSPSQGQQPEPNQGTQTSHRERAEVVEQQWDANDAENPVVMVLPDGGVSLAYHNPTSPSHKSTAAQSPGAPRPPSSTAAARCLPHLLPCGPCAAPQNQPPSPRGASLSESLSLGSISVPPVPPAASSASGDRHRRVACCSIELDKEVLEASLVDTRAAMQLSGALQGRPQPGTTAVESLLEGGSGTALQHSGHAPSSNPLLALEPSCSPAAAAPCDPRGPSQACGCPPDPHSNPSNLSSPRVHVNSSEDSNTSQYEDCEEAEEVLS